MKLLFKISLMLFLVASAGAAEMKVSQYPNLTGLTSNLLFLIAEAGVSNNNISFGSLSNQLHSYILGGTNYGSFSTHSATNDGFALMGEGTNYVSRMLVGDSAGAGGDTNKMHWVMGPTNTVAILSTNEAKFYMQSIPPTRAPAHADYVMTLIDSRILAFGTNQLITLPSVLVAPLGWTVTVANTNVDGSFVLTNATGTQTLRTFSDLAYTNTGIGSVTFINGGDAWWMAGESN